MSRNTPWRFIDFHAFHNVSTRKTNRASRACFPLCASALLMACGAINDATRTAPVRN